ncbi:MAG: hypothetical protein QOE08_674 [Thermoleophilaceae bacterium]|nr:hypothetical protein [Thermoleophilaceae bacterium]
MRPRGATGLLAAGVLALGAGILAVPAHSAVYGLLDHYEVCSPGGEHVYLPSLSVRDKVYAGGDDVVHVLSQRGAELGLISGTGRPGESFRDPIVGTSAAGALFVINHSHAADPRLYKFNGGMFERELALGDGPYGLEERLRSPWGLVASRPGGRGVAAGEVFVGDVTTTGLPAIKAYDASGPFSELYSGSFGHGSPVGISAVTGALGVANNTPGGPPGEVALFRAGSKPIAYVASFPVLAHLDAIAGAPDNTWWVMGGAHPGFLGLEHYSLGGDLLDRVPMPSFGYALSVAPDGAVWVTRHDGLLRIGRNGGAVPVDQFGRGKCGPPEVRPSVPSRQQVIATRTLLVAARCNEACTVRASGTLSVPGGAARTFKLRAAKRRLAPGRTGRLKLGLSRQAAAALRRAKKRGSKSHVLVRLGAADAGMTKSSQQLRLTIG